MGAKKKGGKEEREKNELKEEGEKAFISLSRR